MRGVKLTGTVIAVVGCVLAGCGGADLTAEEACAKAEAVVNSVGAGNSESEGSAFAEQTRDRLQLISDDSGSAGQDALEPAIEALDVIAKNGNEGNQESINEGLDKAAQSCGWN